MRFELAFKALNPSLHIIAPWRLPEFCNQFRGRQDLLKFAAENNVPVSSSPSSPWSMDENLAHCSYEAGVLEDPDRTPVSFFHSSVAREGLATCSGGRICPTSNIIKDSS